MRLTATLTRNGLLFSLLILGLVLWGFWRTYFSNPLQLEGLYLHLHGAGMTLWCVLLVVQLSLIRWRQPRIHRLIGTTAFVLVPLNVILMLAVVQIGLPTFDELYDQGALNATGYFFVTIRFIEAILFGVFFGYAMVHRKTPAIHARYMLCTPLPVIAAATNRIIRDYAPGLGTFWTDTVGAVHLETLTWLTVDIGLFVLATWDFVVHRSVNVFGRVLSIFVVLQVLAIYSPRLPFIRLFADWFVGL
jgi:hypothetical protein